MITMIPFYINIYFGFLEKKVHRPNADLILIDPHSYDNGISESTMKWICELDSTASDYSRMAGVWAVMSLRDFYNQEISWPAGQLSTFKGRLFTWCL